MASSRKRTRKDMETVDSTAPTAIQDEPSILEQVRNMWEFANLAQFIFLFGRVFKVDENVGIEELEMAVQNPQSTLLQDIGLAFLKFVSSHRGLTPDMFDEYTRRQYVAKAPERNPFGDDEIIIPFSELPPMSKIRVLQQLTQWTMYNPDRFRERIHEIEGVDKDQAYWRVEPFGWDSQDRTYIVLDDNRLYRQTEALPAPKPKPASKKAKAKAKAAARASKRRKLNQTTADEDASVLEDAEPSKLIDEAIDNGLGGATWECLAISLDQFNEYLDSIEKSKDVNEMELRQRIKSDILPLLEKQEEARKRKQAQRDRDLLNLQKLATAKRSGRLAGKAEQRKQEEELREAERKAQADIVMAKKQQEESTRMEQERESRLQTREQRLREREARRMLHEADLASLSESSKNVVKDGVTGRVAERHLKAEMKRKKAALEELQLEDDWFFDCICGVHGKIDDGTLSIACGKCNVWQHAKCVGVNEADLNDAAFEFICKTCIRREKEVEVREARRVEEEEEAKNRQSSGIKIKLFNRQGSSSLKPGVVQIPHDESTRNGSSDQEKFVSSPQQLQAQGKTSPVQAHYQGNGATPPLTTWIPRPSSANVSPYKSSSSPSNKNAFQPPQAKSPTSLPPPRPSRNYDSVDQSSSVGGYEGLQSPAEAYYRQQTGHATPAQQGRLQQESKIGRRISTNFPSPLIDAPVLKPSSSFNGQTMNGTSTSNNDQHGNHVGTQALSPAQTFATPTSQRFHQADPAHLAALPDPSTGLSPTKTSPPRLAGVNGSMSNTPNTIPPVPTLSPSPQQQNLTPPVKMSTGPRTSIPGYQAANGSSPIFAPGNMTSMQLGADFTSPVQATLSQSVILAAPDIEAEPMSSPVKSQSPITMTASQTSPVLKMKPLDLNGSSM